MFHYVEAPHYEHLHDCSNRLFLAGGISGCWDWQAELVSQIKSLGDITVYNPRRKNFVMDDPKLAREQINWECHYLDFCNNIVFWFSHETIQPITLLEFGRWTASDKKLFIGCESLYPRREDVQVQLEFIRPEQRLHSSLKSLAQEINEYFA